MKIYISLPITGRPLDRVKLHADSAAMRIRITGHKAVTPFDICPDPDRRYSYYMGKDIEELLECDAIYLCRGWWRSRGCRLEFAAALIYGKKVFFE